MMFRNLQPEELTKLSEQIDCYSYIKQNHFTNDPQPLRYSTNEPPTKETRNNSDRLRIAETIKEFIQANKIH
jgi:hypothetical protein